MNKDYGDAELTQNDFARNRGMTIKVAGREFNLNPDCLNIDSSMLGGTSTNSEEECRNDAISSFYKQLEQGTRAGYEWYKEDFEGILQVNITSGILVELDSDYSMIWDNLSDWTDSVGVKPYDIAKPSEVSSGSHTRTTGNCNITSKIPAGEIGAGYGFIMENLSIGGANFGNVCIMLEPYLFEVRGNVYDNISQ